MKVKSLIIFILGLIIFNSCNQPKSNSKTFVLKGTVEGTNTKYLILHYNDSSDVGKSDTIKLHNNTFFKEGYLNNTQEAAITSNLTGEYLDANGLLFFLEPTTIHLALEENKFAEAKINGSKTQIEYVNVNNKTKPFYDKIEVIQLKRLKLINKKYTGNKNLEEEINNYTLEWQKILDEIKNVHLQYAFDNPKSYLSAYLINHYRRTLPTDSLSILYSNLNPVIQESSLGLSIQEQIKLHIVNSGDVAPNFSQEDIDGNDLSLTQFKGKTVLLDFGAAWCVPCKKEIPEVKKIYDEYHTKGLEIIGISFDKDEISWKENVKNEKLAWHHIFEGMGNVGKEGSINKLYYVQPIPAYILINEKGIIIDRYRGADKDDKSLNDLEEKLNTLLTSN